MNTPIVKPPKTKGKFYYPLIKFFGGKGGKQINKWIISHFPQNHHAMHYLEGCIGGGSILFNKGKNSDHCNEYINDINPELINLYRTVRDDFDELYNTLLNLEYSQQTFEKALRNQIYGDVYNNFEQLSNAANFYIKHRMSRAGIGKDFCWSSRTRRGMPETISAWKTALDQLHDLSRRLQTVRISNTDINVILDNRRERSDLFSYIDLPYVQSTRSTKNVYQYECGEQTHHVMCEIVTAGDFLPLILISGYHNELYQNKLEKCGFNRYELKVANHSAQNNNSKQKRVECVWANY